jgi:hypothetical protein
MTDHTLSPMLAAAIGYAHIVGGIPRADLIAGIADDWKSLSTAAFDGPRERLRIVHAACDLCIVTRRYHVEHEFERALFGLLHAAGLSHDAPEGREWRRASEDAPWFLYPQHDHVKETPGLWSARSVNGAIVVSALPGVKFETAREAISAATTVRRRCLEGHGNPTGAAFADALVGL